MKKSPISSGFYDQHGEYIVKNIGIWVMLNIDFFKFVWTIHAYPYLRNEQLQIVNFICATYSLSWNSYHFS